MKNGIFLLSFLLIACQSNPAKESATAPAQSQLPKTLEEAVKSNYRSSGNLARDKYRHPLETLRFFGIRPDATVVEIWPSKGWYTEILAPFLSEKGKYIAAVNKKPDSKTKTGNEDLDKWLEAHPDVKVEISDFKTQIAPPESADFVLTFRNVHNWMMDDAEEKAFKSFYQALKPGGILGVVEHRARAKKLDPESGYIPESTVIKLAEKAGFKLVEKSEINANPLDTTKHPNGVWTLPPVNRHSPKDNAKYLAIGESDRMTLKFRK